MALSVESAFRQLITSGRGLSHAYLLYGADDEARLGLALRLAEHLLRTNAAQRHPDYFLLEPAGRSRIITAEAVAELESKLYRTSYGGGAKVVVIHEAERLGVTPANKLLKTLEEPPNETYFFLTAASPDTVMPTIVSRCIPLPLIKPGTRIATETERNAVESFLYAAERITPLSCAALGLSASVQSLVEAAAEQDVVSEMAALKRLKAEAENGAQVSVETISAKEEVIDGMQAARAKYHASLVIVGLRAYITEVFSRQVHLPDVQPYWGSAIQILSDAGIAVERGANRKLVLDAMSIGLIATLTEEVRAALREKPLSRT